MIETLLETMKRSQELSRRAWEDRFASIPPDIASKTEKIFDGIDPIDLAGFNFFEATESVAKELNAIDAEYFEWRKFVFEKISWLGAIGFFLSSRGKILGFQFHVGRGPEDDIELYQKTPIIEQHIGYCIRYWKPKPSSEKHKEIMRLQFDRSHRYERTIGFKVLKRYMGTRPKIQRVGKAWVVSFRGEIKIMGEHKRLKNFVPKGCNRINQYRLDRLKRGL